MNNLYIMEKTFKNTFLYYLLLLSIVLLLFINNSSFQDNNPTCNNFVINVYLYLAFSVCLIGLFAYLINFLLYKNTNNLYKPLEPFEIYEHLGGMGFYILSVILTFVLIFLITLSQSFGNENIFYNHLIWLLFLASISYSLYPRFKSIYSFIFVDQALLITSLIFISATFFYYMFTDFFKQYDTAIGMGLFIALIVIIILELLHLLFFKYSFSFFKFSSYFVIALFSMFVSYDTFEMVKRQEQCTSLPNYPKLSIDFFLDILNLFSRVLFLRSK